MSKGVRSKTEDKASSFLVEVTGMALVLFSLLAFLCVITGEALFWNAGKSVRDFLYGVFGAYTFIFLIHTAMLGVRLVMGKSFIPSEKRLTAFIIRFAVICIFAILHLAINYVGGLSFSEELNKAFSAPSNGEITVFGAVCSLVSYPLALVASNFGAIVFFAVALLLCILFLFRSKVANAFARKNKSERSKIPKKQKNDANEQEQNDSLEETTENTQVRRGFFFNEDAPFVYKTKRELSEGQVNNIPIMSGTFEPKNIIDDARISRQQNATLREQPVRQTQRPVPERGRKINFDNPSQSPMTLGEVSKPIPVEKSTSSFEDTSISKDVYTIPLKRQDGYSNERFEKRYPKEQPDRQDRPAPSNMGGLFDNVSRTPNRQESMPSSANVGYESRTPNQIRQMEAENAFMARTSDRFVSDQIPLSRMEDRNDFHSNSDYNLNDKTTHSRVDDRNDFRSNNDYNAYDNASEPVDIQAEDDYRETASSVSDIPLNMGRSPRSVSASITRQSSSQARTSSFENVRDDSASSEKKNKYNQIDFGDGSIEDMPVNYRYRAPKIEFLDDYTPDTDAQWKERQRQDFCKKKIVDEYKKRGINVSVANVIAGPTVTRFDITVPDDVGLSDIFSAQKDLTFRLQTSGELTMSAIPRTDLIGIEIASEARRPVGMKEVMKHRNTGKFKFSDGLFFMVGEDVLGDPIYLDLTKMPHLLISGATGTGKSVCLNVMLTSLIYNYSPEDFRLVIIDPKVVEFQAFKGIPHLVFNEIIGINEDNRALPVLDWLVNEMERRYQFIASKGFKSIKDYNKSIDPKTEKKMPYLILLVDEFADFVQAKPENKKKIEIAIGRLAQKARAAGISLILATQRPSADVFSSSIKTNIPSRICFKTSSATDSRVVIDDNGAEKLLSRGDCLYKTTEDGTLKRAQCAYISDLELKKIIDYVKTNNKCYYDTKMLQTINNTAEASEEVNEVGGDGDLPSPKSTGARMSLKPEDADEVTRRALRLAIVRHNISSSALRTYLCVGYNKAASIVLWLERMEYISAPLENKTRKPLITREQYEDIFDEEFVEDW